MNREANISEKLIDEKSIVLKYMGIQISKMRKKKKLTIEDIADKTLLSESYIRAIEKGTYACSIIKIHRCGKMINPFPLQALIYFLCSFSRI